VNSADLLGAQLQGANLKEADLRESNLKNAAFGHNIFLIYEVEKFRFLRKDAKTIGDEKFMVVQFFPADLQATHLEGADLRETVGLSQDKLTKHVSVRRPNCLQV
jgi:uncharacterized protein YjbI with pentapeptide repeats